MSDNAISLNLLPWRQKKEKSQKHAMILTVACMNVLCLIAIGLLHLYLQQTIQHLTEDLQRLENTIKAHPSKKSNNRMPEEEWMQLDQLQKTNQLILKQLNWIKKYDLLVTKIRRTKEAVQIEGDCQSPLLLMALIKAYGTQFSVGGVTVDEIVKNKNSFHYRFRLMQM